MNELDIESIHVLLIGAGRYPNWPKMDIPNVKANLEELASLLSNPFYCGIPKDKILVIEDADVENTNSTLQEFFDNIQTSKSTVILYYSGHGLQSTKAMDDLFLATRNIKETRFEASSVRISELRKLFSDCVARKKILLLDCCYAGKITKGFMSDDSSENVAKLNEFDGTYIMAASSEYEKARFDPDDPNSPTKFTGKLIEVIKNGIESDDEYCTLNSIYIQIRNSFLIQKDAPRPVQIGQNNIGNFPIFKNKKFLDRIPRDEQAWNKASVINNVIAYNAFIDEFPQSRYKKEAEKLIQTMEDEDAWVKARDKDTIGAYRYYLSNYLKYAVEARQQLNVLVRMHEEEELWKFVNAENDLESFQKYLDKYPNGKYPDLAKAQIDRLSELKGERQYWNQLDHQSIEALNEYASRYPSGSFYETAKAELAVLIKGEKERLKLEEQKQKQKVEEERKRKEDDLVRLAQIENEARLKMEEERYWQKIVSVDTISSYNKYTSNYPNGIFAEEADGKIKALLAANPGSENSQSFIRIIFLKYWKIFVGLVLAVAVFMMIKTHTNSKATSVPGDLRDSSVVSSDTMTNTAVMDTSMAIENSPAPARP